MLPRHFAAVCAAVLAAVLHTAPACAASETVIYAFQGLGGEMDGAVPRSSLVYIRGALYGTTTQGGYCNGGSGIVFKVTLSGSETVLHCFGASGDGADPAAGLLNVHGVLYGTTEGGGATSCSSGCGTVYRITTKGKEKVLYKFKGGSDGDRPAAALTDVGGVLYGTTDGGGATHEPKGTVFSVTLAGKEKIIHAFKGGTDGAFPVASLVDVKGTLYGTTSFGGGSDTCGNSGCGTVFSITSTGVEKVLHVFGGSGDGQYPNGGLIDVGGTLYGTTNLGGANGAGTVYAITRKGVETVIYSFAGGSDGQQPVAGLTYVAGTFYGTTALGGSSGDGTVFSLSKGGTETVLHSFTSNADGSTPNAAMLNVKGTLFGTTAYGGGATYCSDFGGCGTVFGVSP